MPREPGYYAHVGVGLAGALFCLAVWWEIGHPWDAAQILPLLGAFLLSDALAAAIALLHHQGLPGPFALVVTVPLLVYLIAARRHGAWFEDRRS